MLGVASQETWELISYHQLSTISHLRGFRKFNAWKPSETLASAWKPSETVGNPWKPSETLGNLGKPLENGGKNKPLERNGSG